ncbi:flagellar basal body P-ring formation chaperone FlgA, partial [Ectopseudomonas hydrolytica]|uniref:flagellar basal body P-ring formation chaperone FlgA n=1 Tax=Ectopseudomonas hydrolytica TaxID=2493633 RepID=UPI003C2BAFD1
GGRDMSTYGSRLAEKAHEPGKAMRWLWLSLPVVKASDLSMVERDVGQLAQGYLTDPTQAIGKKLTRQLNSDQIITPAHLQVAEVVRRGDQVVISASGGTVNVRMPGEALTDGAPGQQINVRNLRSQRVIRARVVGPGQVEVAM